MKEQFDKRLADKIKDSFSNHEESYDPAQWEKLRKAYFRPKKNGWAAFWPFISAGIAASLILILVYFPYEDKVDRQVKILTDSTKTENPPLAGPGIGKLGEISKGKDGFPDAGTLASGTEEDLGSASGKTQVYTGQLGEKPERQQGRALQLGQSNERKIEGINPRFSDNLNELQFLLGENSEEQINVPLNVIKNDKRQLSGEEAQILIDQWKSSPNQDLSIAEVPTKAEKLPFRVGLMVSPQSSSNPVSGMNLGAGIVTEFSISRKLKLDVGLAYANQSLSPQNVQQLPKSMATFDASTASRSSSVIGTDYELNFASLDIPVNVKYKVWDQTNSGVYLITGLSTMIYLDQNTVETFQTNSLFIADNRNEQLLYSQSVQEFKSVVTPESGDSTLDFAGLLNLSVGYEYQLNKDFNISLEPFYKFPLGGLTFADQKFSIGGVNFRMNFNFKK